MKKLFTKGLISRMLITTCLLTGVVACKKDLPSDDASINRNFIASTLSREIPYSDWPTIENGILSFRDDSHYLTYAQYLDSVVSFSSENTDTVLNDPNEILDVVEGGLSFASLRHRTEADFATLNQTGWSELSEIPEKHFIYDLTTKSILNENADVKIGTKITHYVNDEYAVTIDETETGLLDNLHSLTTAATYDDIVLLDIVGDKTAITLLKQLNVVMSTSRTTNTPGYEIAMPKVTPVDPCNNPKIVRLDNLRMAYFTNGVVTDFVIDWGDGSAVTTGRTNANINNTWLNNVTHTYTNLGTYTITIKGKEATTGIPNFNPPYDDQRQVIFRAPDPCVTGINGTKASQWQYDNQGMNRAYWGKVWVSHFGPSSNRKHKIGALTESYHKTGGKWRGSRIDKVVAQFSTTKYSANCASNWGDNGADWANNSSTAHTQHTNSNEVGWQQVWANHRIVIGNYTFSFDQYLYPCQ